MKAQQKLKKYRARGHARGRTHPKEIVAATTAADSLSKWLEFRRHGAVEALAVEWCLYKYLLGAPSRREANFSINEAYFSVLVCEYTPLVLVYYSISNYKNFLEDVKYRQEFQCTDRMCRVVTGEYKHMSRCSEQLRALLPELDSILNTGSSIAPVNSTQDGSASLTHAASHESLVSKSHSQSGSSKALRRRSRFASSAVFSILSLGADVSGDGALPSAETLLPLATREALSQMDRVRVLCASHFGILCKVFARCSTVLYTSHLFNLIDLIAASERADLERPDDAGAREPHTEAAPEEPLLLVHFACEYFDPISERIVSRAAPGALVEQRSAAAARGRGLARIRRERPHAEHTASDGERTGAALNRVAPERHHLRADARVALAAHAQRPRRAPARAELHVERLICVRLG